HPRARRTGRRVRADLAETLLFQLLICPTAFRRTAGLCVNTKPSRGRCPRTSVARRFSPIQELLLSEKSSGNVEHGTGSLVAREGSATDERRRRRLHQLVCADG